EPDLAVKCRVVGTLIRRGAGVPSIRLSRLSGLARLYWSAFQGVRRQGNLRVSPAEGALLLALLEREAENPPGILPQPPATPTLKVKWAIHDRRGDEEFRAKLLAAYGGRCAITGCDAEAALEAAYIVGDAETGEQDVSNGLLLRADIHTLFD